MLAKSSYWPWWCDLLILRTRSRLVAIGRQVTPWFSFCCVRYLWKLFMVHNEWRRICVSVPPGPVFHAEFESVVYVRWKLILEILVRTDIGAKVAPIVVKSEKGIEVKILRQRHSEHMLDLCFCVKIHSNNKTNTSKTLPWALRTNNSSLLGSSTTIPSK